MVAGAMQLSPEQLPAIAIPELPVVDWALWANNSFLQYGLLLTAVFVLLRFLDKFLNTAAWQTN